MQGPSLPCPCQMISLVVRARLIGLLKQLQGQLKYVAVASVTLKLQSLMPSANKPSCWKAQAQTYSLLMKSDKAGLQGRLRGHRCINPSESCLNLECTGNVLVWQNNLSHFVSKKHSSVLLLEER